MNNSGEKEEIKIDAPELEKKSKLTLKEVTEDIGAFIHFLKAKADYGIIQNEDIEKEVSSVWMLIANRVDVIFQEGVIDCYLEKEIFSRTLLIVSEPVDKSQEITRRRELIKYFSGCIQQDQLDQVTNFLDRLDEESKQIMINDYQKFKQNIQASNK